MSPRTNRRLALVAFAIVAALIVIGLAANNVALTWETAAVAAAVLLLAAACGWTWHRLIPHLDRQERNRKEQEHQHQGDGDGTE
jgi:hypothetical protein